MFLSSRKRRSERLGGQPGWIRRNDPAGRESDFTARRMLFGNQDKCRLLTLERRHWGFLRPTDRNGPAAVIVPGKVPETDLSFVRPPGEKGRPGVHNGREADAAPSRVQHLHAQLL